MSKSKRPYTNPYWDESLGIWDKNSPVLRYSRRRRIPVPDPSKALLQPVKRLTKAPRRKGNE